MARELDAALAGREVYTPQAAYALERAGSAAAELAARLRATVPTLTENSGHAPALVADAVKAFDATATAESLWLSTQNQPAFQAFAAAWRQLDTESDPQQQRTRLHALAAAANALIGLLQNALDSSGWGSAQDIATLRTVFDTATHLAAAAAPPRPAADQQAATRATPAASTGTAPASSAPASSGRAAAARARPTPGPAASNHPAGPGGPAAASPTSHGAAPQPGAAAPAAPAGGTPMAPVAPASDALSTAGPAPAAFHTLPSAQRAGLLVSRGHHVFPIKANDKVPAVAQDWREVSTNDPDKLRRLFKRNRYNVAIDCGKDNLLVLDLDMPKRDQGPIDGIANGLESFEHLRNGRPLPGTLVVETPAGGRHIYFRVPPGHAFRNRVKSLAPFIDIRTAGGYVVAPGSVINGRAYRVLGEGPVHAPIADLPEWLGAELMARQPAPAAERAHTPGPLRPLSADEQARGRAYAEGALNAACENIARNAVAGQHNDVLYRTSLGIGNHVGAGWLDYGAAEQALLDAAIRAAAGRRDADPESKMAGTIRRGLDAGLRDPRQLPPDRRAPQPSRTGPRPALPAGEQEHEHAVDPPQAGTDLPLDAFNAAAVDPSTRDVPAAASETPEAPVPGPAFDPIADMLSAHGATRMPDSPEGAAASADPAEQIAPAASAEGLRSASAAAPPAPAVRQDDAAAPAAAPAPPPHALPAAPNVDAAAPAAAQPVDQPAASDPEAAPGDPFVAHLGLIDALLAELERLPPEQLAQAADRFAALLERAGTTAVRRSGSDPQPPAFAGLQRGFDKAMRACAPFFNGAGFILRHPIRTMQRAMSGLVGQTLRGDGATHRFVGSVLRRSFHALARLIDRHQDAFARDPRLLAVGQAAHSAAEALRTTEPARPAALALAALPAPAAPYPGAAQVRAGATQVTGLHRAWQRNPLHQRAQTDGTGTDLAFRISAAAAPPPWSGVLTEEIVRIEATRRLDGARAVEALLDHTVGADPAQRQGLHALGQGLSRHAERLSGMADQMRAAAARAAVSHRPRSGGQPHRADTSGRPPGAPGAAAACRPTHLDPAAVPAAARPGR